MADIQIKCPQCGAAVGVSEYADRSALRCRACGAPLDESGAANQPERSRLRLKQQAQPPVMQPDSAAGGAAAGWRYARITAHAQPRRRLRITQHILSWLLFVVVAAVMWYLRYGGGLNTPQLAWMAHWGPYLLLVVHVMVVLRAFKDAIFQGILCLLVPLYSLVYLFLICDYFFMRAIVAGLLVGIGMDSLQFYEHVWTRTVNAVNAWIESGGGK